MKLQGRPALYLAPLIAGLLLSGCQAEPPSSPPRADLVPLARPLPLMAMTEPMVVEFDLEPPTKNATTTLFLGIRVRGKDPLNAADISREVKSSDLRVELHLKRLDANENAAIPLVRIDPAADASAPLIPIGTDGLVTGGWSDDVDDLSLEASGLAPVDVHYAEVALAWAQHIDPGKYQMSIRLIAPSAQLAPINSELLIAYRHRSK